MRPERILLVLLTGLLGCGGGTLSDFDGDGSVDAVDCDPDDPSIHPAATEVCDDGVDNDCDTWTDCDDVQCSGLDACATGDDDDSVGDDDDSVGDDDDSAGDDDDSAGDDDDSAGDDDDSAGDDDDSGGGGPIEHLPPRHHHDWAPWWQLPDGVYGGSCGKRLLCER